MAFVMSDLKMEELQEIKEVLKKLTGSVDKNLSVLIVNHEYPCQNFNPQIEPSTAWVNSYSGPANFRPCPVKKINCL